MTFKEFIIKNMQVFFFLVTMILLAEIIMGMALDSGRALKYSDLFTPVITAGLCMIPACVTYSKKELTLRQLLIRKAIQLLLIEGVVLTLTALSTVMSHEPLIFILMGAVTLVIYLLSNLFLWVQQNAQSKKMTEQLKALQNEAESE